MGYKSPTPIQEQAIPIIQEHKDLIACAQTGTGKTAAYLLPIIDHILKAEKRYLNTLIIAPTRELAIQIDQQIDGLGYFCGVGSIAIYGGNDGIVWEQQKRALKEGVDIVCATPGRLTALLQTGHINFEHLQHLVLDEADKMLDMGFLDDIKNIIKYIPEKRQTILFSATMPKEIQVLAQECLTNPETIETAKNAAAVTVSHALFPVSQHLKTELLLQIMYKLGAGAKGESSGSVLVFTRTKHRAKRLAETLAGADFRAASLQGNLSQAKREKALSGFRDGTYQVLVATDIAARGIDVSQISHVINYDIPDTTDAYIHRIGRTGRAAKTGDAYTFVTEEDHGAVRAIERVLKKSIERRTLEGFNYKAAAPQKNEFARPPQQGRQAKSHAGPKSGVMRDGRSMSANGFRRKKR